MAEHSFPCRCHCSALQHVGSTCKHCATPVGLWGSSAQLFEHVCLVSRKTVSGGHQHNCLSIFVWCQGRLDLNSGVLQCWFAEEESSPVPKQQAALKQQGVSPQLLSQQVLMQHAGQEPEPEVVASTGRTDAALDDAMLVSSASISQQNYKQ